MKVDARSVGGAVAALALGGAVAVTGCNVVVGASDYAVGNAGADGSADGAEGSTIPAPEAGDDGGTGPMTEAGADAVEAATCTPVTVTPLPMQGGAGCQQGDSATCWPHDTTSFTATWVQPVGAHLGVCTAAQLSDFFVACEDTNHTTQSCDAWSQSPANTACYGCVYTPSTATRYGAIVNYPNSNLDQINLAGCIALAEPCNEPCAAAMVAQLQCENAACTSPYCLDFTSYQGCASEADVCGACSAFTGPPACQDQLKAAQSQHPAVTMCNLNAADFRGFFTSVATFMCGS